MDVLGNLMNWDPVLWMSLLMILFAIAIIVFLSFKVKSLMDKDAASRKNRV